MKDPEIGKLSHNEKQRESIPVGCVPSLANCTCFSSWQPLLAILTVTPTDIGPVN